MKNNLIYAQTIHVLQYVNEKKIQDSNAYNFNGF
jgi:hypothetical protein